jgi:ribosomal-protein-alanine N-acetyltransferase
VIAHSTVRLKFREITEGDSGFIFELYSTETFKRFIADKNFQSAEDARKFIVNSLSVMYRTPGLGLMLVELQSDSTPIGICGLIKRNSLDEVDLGFGYLPVYEGLGYGREAAGSFVEFAQQQLCLQRLVAITTSDNTPSINLLDKLGFRFEQIHEHLTGEVTLGLYGLDLAARTAPHKEQTN